MILAASAHSDWSVAVSVVGVAWAIAAGYIAWRLTGGKHWGEKDRK